jgi:hypothetical protein
MSFALGGSHVVVAQNLDVPITIEEQIRAIQNDPYLTEAEKQFHINRFALFEFDGNATSLPADIRTLVESNSNVISGRNAILSRVLPVPHIRQQTNWWCGPSTAIQTLSYWNRTVASRYVADQRLAAYGLGIISQHHLGTSPVTNIPQGTGRFHLPDIPLIVSFVNSRIGPSVPHRYIMPSGPITNRNTLNWNIFFSINSMGIPPIIRVQDVAGWPYSTTGHFLNISGMQARGTDYWVTHVQLTDPYVGTEWLRLRPGHSVNTSNGTFWVDFDTLFRAMTADGRVNWAW